MVQRMLTAKNYVQSRVSLVLSGLIDLPLGLCFLTVGILLWGFYQTPDKENPFAYYIIYQLPAGVRGILVAGLFATAMGSLSTALNALATSFTEDWYMPYINPGAAPERIVRAARVSTVFFSIILIVIGAFTAYASVVLHLRIIPIVLGVFGYTYGSLVGVFLAGMLTKSRGCNTGNILAMIVGFIAVCLLSGVHNSLWQIIHDSTTAILWKPAWLPEIAFPWRIAFGSVITFSIAVLFPTPQTQREIARAHVANAS
jgi:Na+/proline symporter